MKKFISVKDLNSVYLPITLQKSIFETLQILDNCYGKNRTDEQLGGYVLIVESNEDLSSLKDIFKEPIESVMPEIVQRVDNNYIKALYILSSDFSVTIIFPIEISPHILKEYIKNSQSL